MRVLILRFSSFGDVVLTTSFSAWLKSQFPQISIDYLTLAQNKTLLENLPFINQVHTYEKSSGVSDLIKLRAQAKELSKLNFDFIIDLHGTTRSFFTRLFMCKTPALTIDKWRFERWLLVKFKKDFIHHNPLHYERTILDFKNIFAKDFEAAEFLDHQREQNLKNFTTSPASLVENKNKNILLMAPGASFATKKYPVEYFANIAQEVLAHNQTCEVHIIGSPEEIECDELFALLKQNDRVKNLKGKMSFKEALEYVAQVKVVLSNDSLFAHIADSSNIAALVIFGPTDERFGFAPYGQYSKSYSVKNLSCRPCSTTGSKKCTRSNRFCMDNINRQEIIRDVLERL
jgi:heptosyltransferase-2